TPPAAGVLPDPPTYPSDASRSATAGSMRAPATPPDPPAPPHPSCPTHPFCPPAPPLPPPPPHPTHPPHPTSPTPPPTEPPQPARARSGRGRSSSCCSRGVRLQPDQGDQRLALHRGWTGEAGRIEQRRRKICEAYPRRDTSSSPAEAGPHAGQPNHERNVQRLVIQKHAVRRFAVAAERFPMIGGDGDDRARAGGLHQPIDDPIDR